MTITNPTTRSASSAHLDLTYFVREQARQTAEQVGFTWIGTPNAPSTFQQLRGAFAVSLSTGQPLPVSNLFCDSTIFQTSEDNIRFRFWHDVHHVKLGLSFRLEDELELGLWQLDQAVMAGFKPGSEAYNTFKADIIGQVLLMAIIGRFPFDQAEFAATCAEAGLINGLLDEIRRMP